MALTPRLEIRQTQSLSLTPQLMQSIKLLQLSHLDLNRFVEEELLANPLLERADPAAGTGETEEGVPLPPENSGDVTSEAVDPDHMRSAIDIAGELDTDVANIYPEQVGQDSLSQSRGETGSPLLAGRSEGADIEQYVAEQVSLAGHLHEQAGLLVDNEGDLLVARNLIDNLDEAGYLRIDTETLARQMGTDIPHIEAVLARMQKAEPAGVFARDLKECLALQLREKNRLDPMMEQLLERLDLVAAHDLDRLKREIGASTEDLAGMLEDIRQLDPRPGRAYDGAPLQAVVPDVFVTEGANGEWQVELNTDVLPRVLVDRAYYATVTGQARDKKEKTFLVDCLQSANWLIKSLDQRAQTILKVATEIVKMQDGFLTHGVSHLRPMTLKNVADAIQMHESTVSRVTANKYMATHRGVFEMKYFFTSALSSSDGGEDASAQTVKHLIARLIEKETAQTILSDDKIAEILDRTHGIEVARRTVAKYREGLNIPSSVIRRRQKRNAIPTG